MKNSEFFNALSSDYDLMINFENSLKNKMENFKGFISPDYRTALDLGCGSGADSIALSKLGLKVDAVDHSEGMLKKAAENFDRYNVKVNLIESGLENLKPQNKYDLIVSLGNTIANIDGGQLEKLISRLKQSLQKNGMILFQLINYSKLPRSGDYVLNEFENDSISIVRKYEIQPKLVRFIIKKVDKKSQSTNKIITELYPHSKKDFLKITDRFSLNINIYGNLKKDVYIKKESKNLIIILSL